MVEVDSSDPGRKYDFKSLLLKTSARGGTAPTITLSCQVNSKGAEMFNAAIQLDPENTYEEDPERSPTIRHVSGTITLGDKKETLRFFYHGKSTRLVPKKRAIARRLFNTAARGGSGTLKVMGKTYDLQLPQPNKDLSAFAKTCPITNGGKFDPSIFDQPADIELEDAA